MERRVFLVESNKTFLCVYLSFLLDLVLARPSSPRNPRAAGIPCSLPLSTYSLVSHISFFSFLSDVNKKKYKSFLLSPLFPIIIIIIIIIKIKP